MCLPLLIVARASRTVQPSPFCNPTRLQLSAPDTEAWRLLGWCGFARMGVWRREKTLGGFLSTPSDISKAIREGCRPGTLGASTLLAIMMYGAQVVPINKVNSKHLMAASCPRWILPFPSNIFHVAPACPPCAQGSGDRHGSALASFHKEIFFFCHAASLTELGGGAGGCFWFWLMFSKGLMGSM